MYLHIEVQTWLACVKCKQDLLWINLNSSWLKNMHNSNAHGPCQLNYSLETANLIKTSRCDLPMTWIGNWVRSTQVGLGSICKFLNDNFLQNDVKILKCTYFICKIAFVTHYKIQIHMVINIPVLESNFCIKAKTLTWSKFHTSFQIQANKCISINFTLLRLNLMWTRRNSS